MCFFLRELKKSSLKICTLFLLVLCLLLINGVMLTTKIDRYNAATTLEYRAGYKDVYNRVEGDITIENMNWIVTEKNRLNELIIGGQFSTEACHDTTYTGYIFSDNNLINELYNNAKYAYNYETYARSIEQQAFDAASLYSEKGNKEISEKYRLMANQFSNRKITRFYRTNGWAEYFSYEFSNLPILLLIVIAVFSLFSQEYETGMAVLLRITPNGFRYAAVHKIFTALLFAWCITTIFSLQDFCIFANFYEFRGFSNPLYSIPSFQNTMLSINIGTYVIINYLMKFLGMCSFTTLVLISSVLFRSNILSFMGSIIALVVEIIISSFFPAISFLPLLNSMEACSMFEWYNVLGLYVPMHLFQIATQFVFCVLGVIAAYLINTAVCRKRRWF